MMRAQSAAVNAVPTKVNAHVRTHPPAHVTERARETDRQTQTDMQRERAMGQCTVPQIVAVIPRSVALAFIFNHVLDYRNAWPPQAHPDRQLLRHQPQAKRIHSIVTARGLSGLQHSGSMATALYIIY